MNDRAVNNREQSTVGVLSDGSNRRQTAYGGVEAGPRGLGLLCICCCVCIAAVAASAGAEWWKERRRSVGPRGERLHWHIHSVEAPQTAVRSAAAGEIGDNHWKGRNNYSLLLLLLAAIVTSPRDRC